MSDNNSESPTTNLENVLTEMSSRATVAALEAWNKAAEEGRVGNYALPEDPGLRNFCRKWFITGYGLALVDYTMEATKRLKAAADIDQERNLSKFKV